MNNNWLHALTVQIAVPLLGTLGLYSIALAHAAANPGTTNPNLNGFLNNPLSLMVFLGFLQLFSSALFLIPGRKLDRALTIILYSFNGVLLVSYLVFMGIALTPNGVAGLMSWLMVPLTIPVWIAGLVIVIAKRFEQTPISSPKNPS